MVIDTYNWRSEALSFPPWHRVVEYRWLLCANGCLAFAMNVVHALFIKSSSAITFILTGVLMKDRRRCFCMEGGCLEPGNPLCSPGPT